MPSDEGPPPPAKHGRMRRFIGVLPSPRDEALLEILRGVRDLVRGREPRSIVNRRRADLAEERWRIEVGRTRLARGDPRAALQEAAVVQRLRPTSPTAATLRLSAQRSGDIRDRSATRPDMAAEVLAAAAELRRLGWARPTVLLYHQPILDSPYQALLYRRAWEHGVAPLPLMRLEELDAILGSVPPDTKLVLHLHWVNRVLQGAKGPEETTARLAGFARRVDQAIAAGVGVVWTVHNVLPHDTPFESADAELRRIIVDRAAMIHVLAVSTPELAAEHYRIPPEKVVHVPLPSFRGAYPDFVSRSAARFALGLPADAYTLLLAGGLKPYKGLDTLLDAFDLAAEREPRLNLLVAGSPSRSDAIDALLARAANDRRIHLHARWIPSDDMQLFMRAADVAILPYLRTLNSAALMTALAFDLPVIAPPIGGIAETIEPAVSVTFEPGDVQSLAAAILAARDLPPEGVRAAARRISEAHDADALSDTFFTALLAAISPGGAAD